MKSSDGIGSSDFDQLISSLDKSRDYDHARSSGSHEGNRHMHEKVQRRILQFLLARFLLLNVLIEEASTSEGKLRPSDHRHLWVLLQARPTDMFHKDPFMELSEALNISSVDDLREQIKEQYSKLQGILEFVDHPVTGLSTRRPFYFFLDEIQITTKIRMGEYWSGDNKMERPLLRPIWQTMTEVLKPEEMLVILSGTAINESLLQNSLGASIFKPEKYTIMRDIGAFDDPDAQRLYIERYLPGKQSETRHEFLKRAWGWCRGRYSIFSNPVARLVLTTFFSGIVVQQTLSRQYS
jgi:hypothetical protein